MTALEENQLVRFIDYSPYLDQASTIDPGHSSVNSSDKRWSLPEFTIPNFSKTKHWILFEDLSAFIYGGIAVKDVVRLVHHALSLVYEVGIHVTSVQCLVFSRIQGR